MKNQGCAIIAHNSYPSFLSGTVSSIWPLYLTNCQRQGDRSKAISDCIEHAQAYHCTGSDTVVGNANVSSSIFAMLFVGWLIGLAMGSGLVLCLRRRRSYRTGSKPELPLTTSPAAAVRTPLSVPAPVSCMWYMSAACSLTGCNKAQLSVPPKQCWTLLPTLHSASQL